MNAAEQAQMTEWKKRAAEYRTNWVREESKRILLEQERDAAMAVLAPSMPSNGLVDAAKQVKQVAISEKDNAETLEAENTRLENRVTTIVGLILEVACPVCSSRVPLRNGVLNRHMNTGTHEVCTASRGLLVDALPAEPPSSDNAALRPLAREHMRRVHGDGSSCPDGCDMAPLAGTKTKGTGR